MPVHLKSRQQACVNGFLYEHKPTGWKSHKVNPRTQWDFKALCAEYQKFVLANPKLGLDSNMDHIVELMDRTNAERMLTIPGAQIYVDGGGESPPKLKAPLRQKLESAVGGAKKYLSNTVAGAKLYIDWFGHGAGPVSKEQSEARALVCLKCPLMVKGNFAQRWNHVVAKEIATVVSIITDLQLTTQYDKQLGICDPCDCPMEAKVHSPLEMVLKHIKPEAKEKLWVKCWIRLEEGSSQTTPLVK